MGSDTPRDRWIVFAVVAAAEFAWLVGLAWLAWRA
jgi:hypothetical protein